MSIKKIISYFYFFVSFLMISCEQTNQELIAQGTEFQNSRKYKEAILAFTIAINRNNKLQLAYYNRGLCYSNIKSYHKALYDFNHILSQQTYGDYILTLNAESPIADEEAKMQVPYYDVLYQKAQAEFFIDSLKNAFDDFGILVVHNYKEKVSCIIYQGDILHQFGDEKACCSLMRKARELAITKKEIDEADKMIKASCPK